MKLPQFLKKYFWEVDFKSLDLNKSNGYIIARVLEYGDIPAIRWLFRKATPEEIKEVILKSRALFKKADVYIRCAKTLLQKI